MSPHGVRIGGAPGASLWIGCSSANRALAGKLLWDGIVAVPKVFDSGCSVLLSVEERGQPGGSARSGDAGERDSRPGAPRLISLACGHIATHGGTQGVAESWTFGGYQSSANQLRPPGGRCIGSTGLAGSPRRPRIMEGPLVSDTTELLSGAPSASEDAPVGSSAPAAAAGGSAEGDGGARSDGIDVQVAQSRWHWPFLAAHARAAADRADDGHTGGRPDAQGAACRGDPGPAGRSAPARMRVSPTKARTSVSRPRELTRLACGSRTLWNQTHARSLASETTPPSGLGASAHSGIGADGAGQQLSFDQEAVADRPNGRTQQAPAQPTEAQQPRPSQLSPAGPGQQLNPAN